MPNPKDLGTMLVDAGKISSEQLTQALSLVEKGKGPTGADSDPDRSGDR